MKSLNRKRLTQIAVDRIKYDEKVAPRSGRMEIEDETCPGLMLRITPRNVKTFSVIYRVVGEGGTSSVGRLLTGKQHRITLGATPPLELLSARRQAREIIQAATEGRDLRTERLEKNLSRASNTFEAAFQRFMEIEIIPNVGAWRNVDGVLRRHALPRWGKTPILDLRRSHIHELMDELIQSGRHGVAREVRKHLSRFFNWAVDREIIGDNPIHGFKRSDLQSTEDAGRALEDHEIRLVWEASEALGYGFGVGITPAGRTMISHSGAFALGAGTHYAMIPSAGVGIAVLTNAAPSGAAEALGAYFTDLVQFGVPTRLYGVGKTPSPTYRKTAYPPPDQSR